MMSLVSFDLGLVLSSSLQSLVDSIWNECASELARQTVIALEFVIAMAAVFVVVCDDVDVDDEQYYYLVLNELSEMMTRTRTVSKWTRALVWFKIKN